MTPKMLNSFLRTMCCLFIMPMAFGQTLNKPVPASNPNLPPNDPWTAVCASESFNQYFVNFTWNPPVVGSSNEFILELSDANGDFTTPTELARATDKNEVFDFEFEFTLPEDTQGDNYRFRVRSTEPALTSEPSDAYSMYFLGFRTPVLISENGNGTIPQGGSIAICDGGSVTLATHNVDSPENYQYNWYRSTTLLPEKSNSLEVTESGFYSVEIDYGPTCSGSAATQSNLIEVSLGTSQGIAINPPTKTVLCPTDVITLEANIDNANYDYTWFKDSAVIAGPTPGGSNFTIDASIAGFEGAYSVAIAGNGICNEQSSAIGISSSGSFTVNRENQDRLVLLPAGTVTLNITTDASNPAIQWFRNDVEINGETNLWLTVSEVGTYYASVTETGGSCGSSTKTSEITEVVLPESFELVIDYDGSYENCQNSSIVLQVTQILATSGGTSSDVTDQVVNEFNYQWQKDGSPVAGANGSSISVASSVDNGNYVLNGSLDSFSPVSNELSVILNSGETVSITSSGAQLCDGVSLTINTSADLTGASFGWLLNGNEFDTTSTELTVSEAGVYQLSISSDGCPILSNEITISNFDESIIVVDAEENIVFPEGESQTVTASGGTSYEWYDASNALLSSTASVTLELEGDYVLIASVDNCQITKAFTVTYRDDFQIPNVITANGDGINDLWVIPNTYSRRSDVAVIIYNETGAELLNQTAYANNWPPSSMAFPKRNQLFYYKIRKDNQTLKQGTITVIK